MSVWLLLNWIEINKQINTLLSYAEELKKLGTMYQEGMESMAECWQGDSGASFAEAAEKVQGGFYVNGFVLERLINDATRSRRLIEDQNTLAASQISAMEPEPPPTPYKQGRAVR